MRLKICLAQLENIVGDFETNLAQIRGAYMQAKAQGADLVLFPELFLSGYPLEDLALRPVFQQACRKALLSFQAQTAQGGPALVIGLPWEENGRCLNAVALVDAGDIRALRFKTRLPDYGVFDEPRIFQPAPENTPVSFRNLSLGLLICEDMWAPDLVRDLTAKGAQALLVVNASPYWRGKHAERLEAAYARVQESGLPLLYVNLVGGQDEIVFDGGSFSMNAKGELTTQLPFFQQALTLVDLNASPLASLPRWEADQLDYEACMVGVRSYVEKNNFPDVLLGLSGGIDSALCAALCVDALGPERVRAFMLPSPYTSKASLQDAHICAHTLHIAYQTIELPFALDAIHAILQPFLQTLPPAPLQKGLMDENIQSRLRGLLLMALSNRLGSLLITTGNKSEMAVGYTTLYGDMNGGFNPIKDVYKTQVFRLVRLRNHWKPAEALGPLGPVIPAHILLKAPSAELRVDQKDQDSLPPYEILDAILEGLVERDLSIKDMQAEGFSEEVVRQTLERLYQAEYKRRQSAPGVKISRRHFGRDRRYPIVNRFRE